MLQIRKTDKKYAVKYELGGWSQSGYPYHYPDVHPRVGKHNQENMLRST
jgi:hypothetical protein